MKIGDISARSRVPASTIRYWERIGVLPKPVRLSGQRIYGPDAIYRLAVLRLARECGFRLEEMRHLLHGFRPDVSASRRWQDLATKKREEIDGKIAGLKAMRGLVDRVSQCRCADLTECGRITASVMEASAR